MPRCVARTACMRHSECNQSCYARRRCNNTTMGSESVCCSHRKHTENPVHQCPICYEDIVNTQTSVSLHCRGSCTHTFHKLCLSAWIKSDKDTCPNCRDTIPTQIITQLDPQFYNKRMTKKGPLQFLVPGVASFTVPRPIGMSDEDMLTRISTSVTLALAAIQATP